MGGGVRLESKMGQGTTAIAWCRAPLAPAVKSRQRVLVVEDNATNAAVTLDELANALG